jgi:hypothetical protein
MILVDVGADVIRIDRLGGPLLGGGPRLAHPRPSLCLARPQAADDLTPCCACLRTSTPARLLFRHRPPEVFGAEDLDRPVHGDRRARSVRSRDRLGPVSPGTRFIRPAFLRVVGGPSTINRRLCASQTATRCSPSMVYAAISSLTSGIHSRRRMTLAVRPEAVGVQLDARRTLRADPRVPNAARTRRPRTAPAARPVPPSHTRRTPDAGRRAAPPSDPRRIPGPPMSPSTRPPPPVVTPSPRTDKRVGVTRS